MIQTCFFRKQALSQKHTFYSVKSMFLTLGLKFQAWNLKISFQNFKKGTFYIVKCMFLTLGLQFQAWNLGLQFQAWNLEISFQNWENIHFTLLWGFNFRLGILKFHSEIEKYTFYNVKCMCLTLGLQFQVWNLEISFQN